MVVKELSRSKEREKSRWRNNIVLISQGVPLMTLEEYTLPDITAYIEDARKELENIVLNNEDTSHTWGYFPQYCKDPQQYTKCIELNRQLTSHIVQKQPHPENTMSLAFIRRATAKPISDYCGFHIDVDVGVGHQRDQEQQGDIIRLVLNLDEKAQRTVGFIPFTKQQLRAQGFSIPEDNYKMLDFEQNFPKKYINIPARTNTKLYGLKFWASQIPHTGITDELGHFVAAFGCYASMQNHQI